MADERFLNIGDRNKVLIKIGGISALLYVGLSVVGNLMHTAMPPDPAGALETIGSSSTWKLAHAILTSTYAFILPMLIGVKATFREDKTVMPIAVPLITAGVAVGTAQIGTHATIFRILGEKYLAATDAVAKANLITIYEVLWPYNTVLELAHLVVIYLLIVFIAMAMRREDYPKWVAWVGVAGGVIAVAGIIIGEVVFSRSGGLMGDRIFGFSLLPLMVWLLAVGVILIKR